MSNSSSASEIRTEVTPRSLRSVSRTASAKYRILIPVCWESSGGEKPVVKMHLKQYPPRASGWKQNNATQDNKTQLILTVKWALFVLIRDCAEVYPQKQQGHQQCGRDTLQYKHLQTAHHLPHFQLWKATSVWKGDYSHIHPFGSSPWRVSHFKI